MSESCNKEEEMALHIIRSGLNDILVAFANEAAIALLKQTKDKLVNGDFSSNEGYRSGGLVTRETMRGDLGFLMKGE